MSAWRSSPAAFGGFLLVGVAVAWMACGDDDDPRSQPELPYDLLCPGASGCTHADGALEVGVAMRDITPTVTERLFDCGMDQLCPGDKGYTAPDEGENNADLNGSWIVPDPPVGYGERWDDANGNGLFDAVWIAGFGNGRPAEGVHDPLWARALVIRKGETTFALVAVDLVGYFYDEVKRIRDALDPGLGVDLVLVGASHTHEGPDSVGIWGVDEGHSGVDPAYMAFVRQNIIEAITEAAGAAAPARVIAAAGLSGVHPDATINDTVGFHNTIADGRDPVVIDAEMRVARFVHASSDETIATLVNWGNHPEALDSRNRFISSDFVHWLREGVEDGVDRDGVTVAGVGGTAVFINGIVGGLMSPLHSPIWDVDGVTQYNEGDVTTNSVDDPFFNTARAVGHLAALDALRLLSENGEELTDTSMSFATKVFRLPIENWGYHAMFITGVFYGRTLYDWDETAQITETNLPNLETEVAVINIGPMQAITVPGELFPEWYLGGYDGSATGLVQELVDNWYNIRPDNPRSCTDVSECPGAPLARGQVCDHRCLCTDGECLHRDFNPPELAQAPGPPYLRDRMSGDIKMVFGLTPDELGYIIPEYDFELDPRTPYVEDAPGDHYEETNSIGVQIGPAVEKHLTGLLEVLSAD